MKQADEFSLVLGGPLYQLWARFLWQVSRIGPQLVPTHPDRAGGLGFLAGICPALAPVLLAQGVMLAGTIASKIFHAGATLPQFKVEIIALVAVMLLSVLGPLLVFIPALSQAKRVGLREYGSLAQRYVRDFDEKWLRGGAPAEEATASRSCAACGRSPSPRKRCSSWPC